MPRKGTRPDDPEVADLWDLTYVATADWDEELTQRAALLELVTKSCGGTRLSPEVKASVLDEALKEVVKRAWLDFCSKSRDRWFVERRVLTAAALIGLVTETPDDYAKRLPKDRLPRVDEKKPRTEKAISWYYEDVKVDAFIRTHETKCLTSFRDALVRVLSDKEMMQDIVAAQLEGDVGEAVDGLADQIVADSSQQHDTSTEAPTLRPVSSIATQLLAYAHQPFVERERYEQDFQQLLDQHHRRIIFNGGRGNGKSRLALELVSRQPNALEDGIFIKADSPEKLSKELRNILTARGKQSDDPDDAFEAFSKILCKPGSPSYVILDNVDDPTLLKDLLPDHSQSVIVITANRKIPKYTNSSLEVTPMTQSEAAGLVARLLPSLSDEEHQRVAEALGYRPLAIVHACGYILGGGLVPVEEFLADLKKNAASTLEIPDVALVDEPTLTAIYRFILIQLEQLRHAERPIRAKELLELVACVASDDIPPDLIREAMGSPGETPSATKFQEAVLALQTRFLVRVVENRLAIHPLTQEILRALLREYKREQALCLRLHQPIQRMLEGETRNKLVSAGVIDVILHICKVVIGLQDVDAMVFHKINLGRTLAVIPRSMRQMRIRNEYVDVTLSIIGNLYDNILESEALQGASGEDVRELMRELVPTLYSWGGSTSEEYLGQTVSILNITDLQNSQTYMSMRIPDLIDFCTAALECVPCGTVLKILLSQEGRAQNDCDVPVQYGDYKALEGEAWLIYAEWSRAETALNQALEVYESAGDDMLAIRGAARALKLLGDLTWMSGAGKTRATALLNRVTAFARRRRGNWERDLPTSSYLSHFFARQYTAEYLHAYYLWSQYKDDHELAEQIMRDLEHNISKANEAIGFLDQASGENIRGGYLRENQALSYDRILVNGLTAPHSINDIAQQNAPRDKLIEDNLLVACAELARFKVTTVGGGDDELNWLAFVLLREEMDAVGRRGARYWYVEYLAAICILSAQCDSPDTEKALNELQACCIQIGRQDRAAHVMQAINAWRAGNHKEFKRKFAYLLTF